MRQSWDEYFMGLAAHVATRSRDRHTQVGCVIVGPNHEIRSTGYNGFPRGVSDDPAERYERPEKYFWTEHAERNAIYNAARCGTPLQGCRIYVPWWPCADCARAIIQAGIVEVIGYEPDLDMEKWGEQMRRSQQMFEEAGVSLRYLPGPGR